jgi:hypothetical protein
MGYTVETDTTIKGYRGQLAVDIAVKTAKGYGVGFVKNGETYDMVADWWGVAGAGEEKLAREIAQQAQEIQKEYAKAMILEQVAKEGFEMVSQTSEADGTVRIVVRRWA